VIVHEVCHVDPAAPLARLGHLRVFGRKKKSPEGVQLINELNEDF
jgi:hypothetical protein